jgi:hypothetical protein
MADILNSSLSPSLPLQQTHQKDRTRMKPPLVLPILTSFFSSIYLSIYLSICLLLSEWLLSSSLVLLHNVAIPQPSPSMSRPRRLVISVGCCP